MNTRTSKAGAPLVLLRNRYRANVPLLRHSPCCYFRMFRSSTTLCSGLPITNSWRCLHPKEPTCRGEVSANITCSVVTWKHTSWPLSPRASAYCYTYTDQLCNTPIVLAVARTDSQIQRLDRDFLTQTDPTYHRFRDKSQLADCLRLGKSHATEIFLQPGKQT